MRAEDWDSYRERLRTEAAHRDAPSPRVSGLIACADRCTLQLPPPLGCAIDCSGEDHASQEFRRWPCPRSLVPDRVLRRGAGVVLADQARELPRRAHPSRAARRFGREDRFVASGSFADRGNASRPAAGRDPQRGIEPASRSPSDPRPRARRRRSVRGSRVERSLSGREEASVFPASGRIGRPRSRGRSARRRLRSSSRPTKRNAIRAAGLRRRERAPSSLARRRG